METSFQVRDYDETLFPEVDDFLTKLGRIEGDETPLTTSELAKATEARSFLGRLWSLTDPATPKSSLGSMPVGFGIYRCESSPELVPVCLPDHREMSLFLPMILWVDKLAGRTHAGRDLTVWIPEHDFCTSFLLLRLKFEAGESIDWRQNSRRTPYVAPVGRVTSLGLAVS